MKKDHIIAIFGILLFLFSMGFVIYLVANSPNPVNTDNNHIFMEMLP